MSTNHTLSGNMVCVVLRGCELDDVPTVGENLEINGLGRYKPTTRPNRSALHRACRELVGNREVRPLKRSAGYLICEAATYGHGTREEHSLSSEWAVALTPVHTLEFGPGCSYETQRQLNELYRRESEGCGVTETLKAMEKLLGEKHGVKVSTRVWIISPAALSELDQWAGCCGLAYSMVRGTLSVGADEATAETVLTSFIENFREDAEMLRRRMIETPNPNERFWTSYNRNLDQLAEKVRSVETMLGQSLNSLHDVVTKLGDEQLAASVDEDLAAF